jgi:putative Mg2+ transporter-C (MgtC) family protein
MVITPVEMLLRMGTGVALGAAIGYERERTGRPAGLRTHLLVSLASATFMLVSTHFVYFQSYGKEDLVAVDTSRIAASVVTGVGFLGAGAILRTGIGVQGLTTAASLWLVAALGLAAGGGMYVVALAATLVALFGLTLLRRVEGKRWRLFQRRVVVLAQGDGVSRQGVIEELRRVGAAVTDLDYDRDLRSNEARFKLTVRLPGEQALDQMLTRLEALPGVRRVKVQRPG